MKIVVLHGLPLDESMWDPQVAALSEHELTVPNLYGRGNSMDAWAEAILAEVEGSFVACGASMGGYCALAIARHAPERLTGLLLAGARIDSDSPERLAGRAATIERIRSGGPQALWEDMRPKLFPADAQPEPVERAHRMALAQHPEDLVAAVEAIRDRRDSTEAVEALDVPVVIAVGRQDPFISVDEAREEVAQARDGRLNIFENSGHLPNMEQPEQFNEVLLDLLR